MVEQQPQRAPVLGHDGHFHRLHPRPGHEIREPRAGLRPGFGRQQRFPDRKPDDFGRAEPGKRLGKGVELLHQAISAHHHDEGGRVQDEVVQKIAALAQVFAQHHLRFLFAVQFMAGRREIPHHAFQALVVPPDGFRRTAKGAEIPQEDQVEHEGGRHDVEPALVQLESLVYLRIGGHNLQEAVGKEDPGESHDEVDHDDAQGIRAGKAVPG